MIEKHTSRSASAPTPFRSAFSVIELLVSLSIVSLLLGLLLPAVQSSREAARMQLCLSRLRDFGVATQNFEVSHQRLPGGNAISLDSSELRFPGVFSAHTELLPFLDLSSLYSLISKNETGQTATPFPSSIENSIPLSTSVPGFKCPSDRCYGAQNSYRANVGVFEWHMVGPLYALPGFDEYAFMSKITDGLSNTLLFSERLVGDSDDSSVSGARDVFLAEFNLDFLLTPDSAVELCRVSANKGATQHWSHSGASWMFTGNAYTWYNHASSPNSVIPDCSVSGDRIVHSVMSARSMHYGSVMGALCDGSARAISQEIDISVWRGLGTSSKGDASVEW